MKTTAKSLFFLLFFALPILCSATLNVGIGKADITPPKGTPSAGYAKRHGQGMLGVHDPLLAIALFIDNGEKQIVLCSVDHLGFTYEMVQEIISNIQSLPKLANTEIYIASSHTHSGGGAYLNIPVVGESLAGVYDSTTTKFYIQKTVEAIVEASKNSVPAKIGIGYGEAKNLSKYRGLWPKDVLPLSDVAIIKVTKLDDTPLAVLFNYPIHPTVLKSDNRFFSSDFVGYTRDRLKQLLGPEMQAIYFNGAQGDIIPAVMEDGDRFEAASYLGHSLAKTVEHLWHQTATKDSLEIEREKETYAFKPQATPFGLLLPLDHYKSEINLLVLNKLHAFVTIPGELSTVYDRRFKEIGKKLGYEHLSIFGLTNDAHGYIILPEAWRHKTYESGLSFGGENYGEITEKRVEKLLKDH